MYENYNIPKREARGCYLLYRIIHNSSPIKTNFPGAFNVEMIYAQLFWNILSCTAISSF